jgi:hypothetical protein
MTDDERGAVERCAADYFDSWFDGDPERMRRAVHPQLAKRRAAESGSELLEVPADDLVEGVSGGPQTGYDRHYEIQVLDIDRKMASVLVRSDPFIEYLHIGRFDHGWQIVNAFYRRRRDQADQPADVS